MSEVNEGAIERSVERASDRYFKSPKYRPFLEALEKSPVARVRSITAYDHFALGKQLEQFENYKQMCEDDGTLAQLGSIPKLAFDVITASYGTSPLSVMASTQPIEEEQGSVYFKDLIAQTTRGNITTNDTLLSADSASATQPTSFAGDTVTTAATNVTATATQNITLTNVPVRPYKVQIDIVHPQDGALQLVDDGNGKLIGYNVQGTVNYSTGAVVIAYKNTPTAPTGGTHVITSTYAQDFEASTDIPKVIMRLRSKSIGARVWALKDTIGLEQSYAMKRRFGLVAEDEVSNDLVNAINSEMCNYAISRLAALAVGSNSFTKAAPANVSLFEHRQGFKFTINDAEATLLSNAGRGNISVMIAGANAASLISGLAGFVRVQNSESVGPHIFGTLDGIAVIRVQNSAVLNADTLLCMYKGTSPFDTALVWAPYMPLVVTTALPTGTNPLMQQKAAAVWGGLEVLIKNFVTKITLT